MNGPQGQPPISVVMPVYNALKYLDEAVESILGQSLPDFEFVIYDDCSTDGSWERLKEWAARDHRIRLFRGGRNLGPAASSNEAVRHASAPLIARMDADDLAYPERLELQAAALAANPDAGIVASLCDVVDSDGVFVRGPETWRLARSSWFTPFPHGSMMFRRSLYDSIGGYRDRCEYWEDLDFVLRASAVTKILVFPRPLYRYRQSQIGTRLASSQERVERAMDLRYAAIDRIREDRGYDDLLLRPPLTQGEKVDPRVFVSLGSLAIWAGQRPNVGRRFFRRARFGLDVPTTISAIWVLWTGILAEADELGFEVSQRTGGRRLFPRRTRCVADSEPWAALVSGASCRGWRQTTGAFPSSFRRAMTLRPRPIIRSVARRLAGLRAAQPVQASAESVRRFAERRPFRSSRAKRRGLLPDHRITDPSDRNTRGSTFSSPRRPESPAVFPPGSARFRYIASIVRS
jgi:glycosyltransferase involved in cell wall biosynthesis